MVIDLTYWNGYSRIYSKSYQCMICEKNRLHLSESIIIGNGIIGASRNMLLHILKMWGNKRGTSGRALLNARQPYYVSLAQIVSK